MQVLAASSLLLLLQCCTLILPSAARPIDEFICPTDSTTDSDLQLERLAILKQEITDKLSLFGAQFEDPPEGFQPSAEDIASFNASVELAEALAEQERENERLSNCKEKVTYRAKDVRVFSAFSYDGELPHPQLFDIGSILGKKIEKRSDKNQNQKAPMPKKGNDYDADSEEVDLTHSEDMLTAEEKELQELLTPIRYSITFNDMESLNSSIWSANLNIYKRKITSDFGRKRTPNPTEVVEVFWMSTFQDNKGGSVEHPVLVASRSLGTEDDGYVAFDITEGLRQWQVGDNHLELRLEVAIRVPESSTTGKLLLPSLQFDVASDKEGYEPSLIVKSIVGSKESQRVVRQADADVEINSEHCLNNPEETGCCLREVVIDFRVDLNIHWILAPRTFKFTYCRGLCPRAWPSTTLNSEYRSLVRAHNPTSSPDPCCVASKTKPLRVLAYENSAISIRQFDGMITESCQCR